MTPLEVYDRHVATWSDIGLHLPKLRSLAVGRVLEIGTRAGISTAALLLGVNLSDGHLYSVDRDDCSALYPEERRWTFLHDDSRNHDRILDLCGRRDNSFRLDLLFLDGDHSYTGAMADLCAYGPWANTIAIHDTSSDFLGVWAATIEYFRSPHQPPERRFKRAEFSTASSGLGVLYR